MNFFFNRVTGEKLAMDQRLYSSLMVQLLLSDPQDPRFHRTSNCSTTTSSPASTRCADRLVVVGNAPAYALCPVNLLEQHGAREPCGNVMAESLRSRAALRRTSSVSPKGPPIMKAGVPLAA